MRPTSGPVTARGAAVSRSERLVAHPLTVAALLAAVYVVVCGLYIVYSDRLAAALATGDEAYQRIQTFKGLAFIVMSGLMLFLFSLSIFRLLDRRRRRIDEQAQALIQAESRAQSGIIAASIAHDINNILTVLNGHAEMLAEVELPVSAREDVAAIARSTGQLTDLVRFLATVGREQAPGRREIVDLSALANEVTGMAATHRALRRRRVECLTEGELLCLVNPQTVARALLNLLVNAADATAEDGLIRVSVAVEDGRTVVLTVDDDGPGVAPADRERIFQEFYTTKDHGNGLGLVSVKYCAQEHGGEWGLDASPLGGARFFVRFPLRTA